VQRQAGRRSFHRATAIAIGLLAVVCSALYLVSDIIEAVQRGFSTGQLWLTLIAEAAIPVFVIGLAVAPRPRLGRLGVLSAVAYAYSYLVFTGTVVYALVNQTKDYATLTDELGALMIVHGALMVLAGLGFGLAELRARTLPAWTALALMTGVVLVALAQRSSEAVQLMAAGLRDVAFAGMGAAVLRTALLRFHPGDHLRFRPIGEPDAVDDAHLPQLHGWSRCQRL
jgi:hypothetical protein